MEKLEAIKRGSIFYLDLEIGIGSEQNGLRPVMIVQNDKGNTYSPTVIVVPITSKPKKYYLPTHVYIGRQFGLPEDSMLLAEHIRTVDRKRLLGFIGIANAEFMLKVDKALKISLGLYKGNEIKCLRLEGSNFRLGGIAPISRAVPSFRVSMRLAVWIAWQKGN